MSIRLLSSRPCRLFQAVSAACMAILFFAPLPLVAESGRRLLPALRTGMAAGEVAALLGPAPSKHEYETNRRVAWVYPFARLVFEEGALVGWQGKDASQPANPPPRPQDGREAVKVSPEAEALLSEILKDIPSDDSGPGAAAGGRAPSDPPPNVALRPMGEDMRLRDSAERD